MITDHFARLPCKAILVEREERQRRDLNLTPAFLSSIKRQGVLQPIIIREDNTLVAGERRLAASIELGLPDIPVRYHSSLSIAELQLVELEENIRRTDLSWQDLARTYAKIHALYSANQPEWTAARTAEAIGGNPGYLSEALTVAAQLDNPRITQQPTMRAAYNVIGRAQQRRAGDDLSSILDAGKRLFSTIIGTGADQKSDDSTNNGGAIHPDDNEPASPPDSLLNTSFLDWAPTYEGKPFNFLHCDFPYGTDVFTGPDSGKLRHTTYSDQDSDYWALIECLCANLDRIMSHSAHMVFWFSMQQYQATLNKFGELAPDLTFNPMPLVWHKSDNVGILPDPQRGPRQVYETAFVASRDDRLIIRATSNAYASPTDKLYHISTKPEPMLHYFFGMFVDETTRMLDPTCGSGSSLRAAERCGASEVLGLEINEEHYENALIALRKFRALRSV